MPNRIIREGILSSDRLSNISIQARWTFLGLILLADDFGRLEFSLRLLNAKIFPLDDVSDSDFSRWVNDIEAACLIQIYPASGKTYIQVLRWKNKPRATSSKYPDPPRRGEESQGPVNNCAQMFADENICAHMRADAPVTVTETVTEDRLQITVTESVTESEGNGRAKPTDGSGPSESGAESDSVLRAGSSDSGSDRFREANLTWQACRASLRAHNDGEVISLFADAIVRILKPDDGTETDRKDSMALARHLMRNDGAAKLENRLFNAFNSAKSVVESGGKYGLWRRRMTEAFGPWSVRKLGRAV